MGTFKSMIGPEASPEVRQVSRRLREIYAFKPALLLSCSACVSGSNLGRCLSKVVLLVANNTVLYPC